MAGRLAALLVLACALAATTGLVKKAGGAEPTLAATANPRTPTRMAVVCPIPVKFRHAFKYAAHENRIPLPMLYAVAWVESHLDPQARSAAGARGLLQVLPSTATSVGVPNIDDPQANIVGGARYLRQMLDRFNNTDLALAAYNAGPTAVAEAGRAPNMASLRYVGNVNHIWTRNLEAVLAC